ncbi:MAG: helix-turn-helix transcriptional regulator [Clostridiales bacterium]|nr:helix-turn-helix transcriptional regulator [Clostridiales bacterium]
MSGSLKTPRIIQKKYNSTFEITIDLIGGKWKPLILWHLSQKRILRFNELRKLIPHITPKMLTQQLRELEVDQLVKRKVYPQVPPKVEYSLTEFGKSLLPVLCTLCEWGEKYFKEFSDNSYCFNKDAAYD